jgi:hydroxymethylbilane synthase
MSSLARWQTDHVAALLTAAWPGLDCAIQPFSTQGDRTQAQNQPLPEIGGKGLFTLELEEALRNGEIDLAVHSLKDLPVEDAPSLTIGAIPARADVRDALVARHGWTLARLPANAVVGTSSTRRTAQLLAARPDLTIRPIRGNVETRLRKVQSGEYDATVLAVAGLDRLGLLAHASEVLPLSIMLPAPGQGALAIQCRAGDTAILELLATIEDAAVRAAVSAERDFLHRLGGGCSAPVAAFVEPVAGAPRLFRMSALVGSLDGSQLIRVVGEGRPSDLAQTLAEKAMAQGAHTLLNRPPQVDTNNSLTTEPLAGKRIVLTRPQEQSQELAEQLAALGAQPLVMPTIRIVPLADLQALDQAISRATTYDWLIFTSANTVAIFEERRRAAHLSPGHADQPAVAAVGPATAEALRQIDLEPDFVPTTFVADAIADGLGDVRGRRILLPQAAAARMDLAQRLRDQGADVESIPVYTTEPADLSADQLAELAQGVDAILFTSGLTARNFAAVVQAHPEALAAARRALILCIGPITAAAAAEVGLPATIVADEATTAGLVESLRHHFAPTKENHAHAR